MIVKDLSEVELAKIREKKRQDGFQDRTMREWLLYVARDVRIVPTQREMISESTKENLMRTWLQNFARNLPNILKGKTIADLVPEKPDEVPKGAAVVVGAGPSIYKYKHLELLAESNFKGVIISTDRMLIPCLHHGIIPNLTVTVDGNREKIVKFYDDPLVDKYGEQLKAALITCVAPNVVKRLQKAKAEIYWYHPIFDDVRQSESLTKIIMDITSTEKDEKQYYYKPKGVPSMTCGGNTGAASWIIAFELLKRSPIGLIGIDLGYLEGTPLEKTAYYNQLMQASGGDVTKIMPYYKEYYNPKSKRKVLTDLVFNHYREAWLEMAAITPAWVETVNCSWETTLFGPNIKQMRFEEFLQMVSKRDDKK